MSPLRRIACLVLVLTSGLVLPTSAADAPVPGAGEVYCHLVIPEKVSTTDLERVLRFVASNRRWVIESQEPGRTRISLKHQGVSSRVCFSYEGHTLVMSHESIGPDGHPVVPSRWLQTLRRDIEEQFALKR
jgi:hypothetical protein